MDKLSVEFWLAVTAGAICFGAILLAYLYCIVRYYYHDDT